MKPETKIQNNKLILVLIIVALEAILFSVANSKIDIANKLQAESLAKIQSNIASVPILAKALSVYDITKNQKIYGKNDQMSMPIASLAKIMTVVVALNNHEKDDVISIPMDAIK